MKRYLLVVATIIIPMSAIAGEQSLYCEQNQRYINIGMTPEEVVNACGQPSSREQSSQPVVQQVPVEQLMYNNQGSEQAFYGVWALPTGVNGGAQLQVNIVDNKVRSVNINGSSTNAFTLCSDTAIKIGDPVESVYSACGNPSAVNNSYINQPIQSNQKPEVWIYQTSRFEPPHSLTFINGKLQSID